MSMSALLSALRGAGRQQLSVSTVATRQTTGSHVLRIDRYTQVSKLVGKDKRMRLETISVGGHDWRINCYPNGYSGTKDEGSHISLFIEKASHRENEEDPTIKVKASILDQAGMPSCTKTIPEIRASACTHIHGFGWNCFISHKDLDEEKHLKDDCLTILCDLTVVTGKCTEVALPPEPMVWAPAPWPSELHGQLVEAIWNKEKPDVTIQVGGETFVAHRWMLEARSPVLKEDLSLTSDLHVANMDAEVFKTLLQFIYTDYPPLVVEATTAEKLLVAADRYRLDKLKLVCEEVLCRHVAMDSVVATLVLAEQHSCPVLREACIRFLSSPGNLEAVVAADGFELLKTGCPSALLELVVNKAMRQEQ
ncbi:BTB/POZ and MATH domain-containing protein 1-like [Lolium rigidum]|uniref:BTB/POZ and MATH domain-containing protein 1-like n=1 Tax=Lolium rigidum TaxID=89674 RepID=UPI001F5E2A4F|nr:BTB/POZ and MATH domain-containing protein 1-like [Lolium rigidum]